MKLELDAAEAVVVVRPAQVGRTYQEVFEQFRENLAKERGWQTEEMKHLGAMLAFARAQCEWTWKPGSEAVRTILGTRPGNYGDPGTKLPKPDGNVMDHPDAAQFQKRCNQWVKIALAVGGFTGLDESWMGKQRNLKRKPLEAKEAQRVKSENAKLQADYQKQLSAWKTAKAQAERRHEAIPPEPPKPSPVKPNPIPEPQVPQLYRVYGQESAYTAAKELPKHGFLDKTEECHRDPLQAAPGDVVVYQVANWKAFLVRSAPAKAQSYYMPLPGHGHVEIRSYDGLMSDFWHAGEGTNTTKREVIGIFRHPKYTDPGPARRVQAFLRLLREWSVGPNPEGGQYNHLWEAPCTGAKRMPNGTLVFEDTRVHPWAGKNKGVSEEISEEKNGSNLRYAAGAYGLSLAEWWGVVQKGRAPADFSSQTQDRVAIYLLYWIGNSQATKHNLHYRNALTCIREGGKENFKTAVGFLRGVGEPGKKNHAEQWAPAPWRTLPFDWAEMGNGAFGRLSLNDLWGRFLQYCQEIS